MTFDLLAQTSGEPELLRLQVPLAREEEALIYATAKGQKARDTECVDRQRPLWEALEAKGVDIEGRMAATLDMRVQCRVKALAIVDDLLDALPPDSRERFLAWVESQRRTIQLYSPKTDVESFRLPR